MTANLVGDSGGAEKTPGLSPSDDVTLATGLPKKDRRKVKAILNSLKKGATAAAAAEAAGIDRITLWRWRRKYPRLNSIIEAIQESQIDEVEDAMMKSAKEGNFQSGQFILTRRRSDKYPDRSMIQNTINIGKNGKDDARGLKGADADEQRRLEDYYRDAVRRDAA